MVIERLEVDGGFLDGLDLTFSPGLNVLVGARGTGKTSVIELLRLCTNAPALADRFGKRAREHALSILRDGKAKLSVRIGDDLHVLERTAREEPLSVPALQPIVLAQNEIEVVGVDANGRLRLVDAFVAPSSEQDRAAMAAISSIKSAARQLVELDAEIDLLNERVSTLPELRAQLAAAEADASQTEQSATQATGLFDELDKVSADLARQAAIRDVLERSAEGLTSWVTSIESTVRVSPQFEDWPDEAEGDPLGSVRRAVDQAVEGLQSVRARVDRSADDVEALLQDQRQGVAELDDRARELRARAEELQAGAGASARRVSELRERLAQLVQLERVLDERRRRREETRALRDAELAHLEHLRESRFQRRQEAVEDLNAALKPRVRISLLKGGLFTNYASAIADALRGSGLHYAQLAPTLAERVAPAELIRAVETMDAAWLAQVGEVSPDRAQRVLSHLRSEGGGAVLTAPIDDAVRLELLDGSGYKDSTAMSTGQRCTVVLPVLLQNRDRPIVLDQPEDHLDTAFIVDTLVHGLNSRSGVNQIIVSTHNANIPVLGEADRVVVLESDGRRGFVRHAGPLDLPKIVAAIEQIMEGGRQAFQQRAEFYSESIE